MTQEEFIIEVINSYIKARDLAYKPTPDLNILTRGTSHTISSLTEDLFGCYCAEKVRDTQGIKIHIDPQFSFRKSMLKNKSGNRDLLIRPDLVITKNDIANCMFDIKTDLGYKRKDLFDQAKAREAQIESIKGKTAFCKDGKTKQETAIKISEELKFIYIILSQGNINPTVLDEFIKEIRELENVNIFFLTKGQHLNTYGSLPDWSINQPDFNDLDEIITTCF